MLIQAVDSLGCKDFTGQTDDILSMFYSKDRRGFCEIKNNLGQGFSPYLLANNVGCTNSYQNLFLKHVGMEDVEINDSSLTTELNDKYESLCIKCTTSYIYTFNYYPCHTPWSKALFVSKLISAFSLSLVGSFILLH